MSPSFTRSPTDDALPLTRQRRDDRQPFGRVVQREADDEQRAERRLAERERRADRQPFAEVVQPDADRDQQRQHPAAAAPGHRAPPRLQPRADPLEQQIGAGRGQREQHHTLERLGQQPRRLEPLRARRRPAGTPAARSVSASRKSMPASGRRCERTGNHSSPIDHGDHADVQPDQREHAEEPRARPSAFPPQPESRARTPCRSRSARARRALRPAPTDTESAASSVRDARAPCRCRP